MLVYYEICDIHVDGNWGWAVDCGAVARVSEGPARQGCCKCRMLQRALERAHVCTMCARVCADIGLLRWSRLRLPVLFMCD